MKLVFLLMFLIFLLQTSGTSFHANPKNSENSLENEMRTGDPSNSELNNAQVDQLPSDDEIQGDNSDWIQAVGKIILAVVGVIGAISGIIIGFIGSSGPTIPKLNRYFRASIGSVLGAVIGIVIGGGLAITGAIIVSIIEVIVAIIGRETAITTGNATIIAAIILGGSTIIAAIIGSIGAIVVARIKARKQPISIK